MIRIYLDTPDGARRVLTTDQAVELAPGRWKNTAALRAWIARHGVPVAAELNARTKLYFPEDLGIDLEDRRMKQPPTSAIY